MIPIMVAAVESKLQNFPQRRDLFSIAFQYIG